MKSLGLLLLVLAVGLFAVGCGGQPSAPAGGDAAPFTPPESDVTTVDETPMEEAPAEEVADEAAEEAPAEDAPAEAPAADPMQ